MTSVGDRLGEALGNGNVEICYTDKNGANNTCLNMQQMAKGLIDQLNASQKVFEHEIKPQAQGVTDTLKDMGQSWLRSFNQSCAGVHCQNGQFLPLDGASPAPEENQPAPAQAAPAGPGL